jgi:uncharacterized protein YjbI with pentapeptide repeats
MKITKFWFFPLTVMTLVLPATVLGIAPTATAQPVWLQKKECRGCDADLSGADLSNTVLHGANLSNTKCRRTNFTNGILSRADLSGADFEGANLQGATLFRAKARQPFTITGANLTGTQMPKGNVWGIPVAPATKE